jgi:hypothetical protein
MPLQDPALVLNETLQRQLLHTDATPLQGANACYLPKYDCSEFGLGTTCVTFDGLTQGPGVCLPLTPTTP